MNTKQLIVLWYAGLSAVIDINVSYPNPISLVFAIFIMAGLLIYTFKPLPEANKKKLIKAIILYPIILVGIIVLSLFLSSLL